MLESDAPRTLSADKYSAKKDSCYALVMSRRVKTYARIRRTTHFECRQVSDGRLLVMSRIVLSGDDDKVVKYLIDYYTPEMTKS
jgi:hypothetical protein